MNKKYIIWGSAGHAKVLYDIISLNRDTVIALFDNSLVSSIIDDVPIFYGKQGFLSWYKEVDKKKRIYGVVAIGGNKGNDRIELQNYLLEYNVFVDSLVHPSASISPTAVLGAGIQVLAQAVIAADTHIAEACIINNKASVDHECNLGSGVHIAPNATLCGCVDIGNNVMIGAGATILPRIKIGENSIVGAGAVVTKNVAPNSVVAGIPARIIQGGLS